MKLTNKLLITIAFVLSAVVLGITLKTTANAESSPTMLGNENDSTIIENETFGDLFVTGNYVNIKNTVNGDAFIFGNNVDINGNVYGNLFVIASSINVNKDVTGSVYTVSENIAINGAIKENLRTISKRIEIKSNIAKSVSFLAQNLYIPASGEIEQDAYGITEKLNLDGKVGKNLTIYKSTESEVYINGKVGGDVVYYDSRPQITDKAVITGKAIKKEIPNMPEKKSFDKINKIGVIGMIINIASMVLFAYIFLKFKNGLVENITNTITTKLLKTSLSGIVISIIFPILLLLLTITLVGIPLVILIVLFSIFWYFAVCPAIFAILIGNKILSNTKDSIYSIIVGSIVLNLLFLYGPIYSLLHFVFFITITGSCYLIYRNRKNK